MRARLTQIRLHTGDRLFEIGEEVVGGEDLPMELLEARLAAGTAVLVLSGDEPGPELAAAIDAYVEAAGHMGQLLRALIEVALGGPAGSARAVMFAMHSEMESQEFLVPLLAQLEARAEADQLILPQDPDGGGDASSEAGGDVGRSPPAETSNAGAPAPAAPSPPSVPKKKSARKGAAGAN